MPYKPVSYELQPLTEHFVTEVLKLPDWDAYNWLGAAPEVDLKRLIHIKIFALDDAVRRATRRLDQISSTARKETKNLAEGKSWPSLVGDSSWFHNPVAEYDTALSKMESLREQLVELVTVARGTGVIPVVQQA